MTVLERFSNDTTESWVNSLHAMSLLSLGSAAPAEESGICPNIAGRNGLLKQVKFIKSCGDWICKFGHSASFREECPKQI